MVNQKFKFGDGQPADLGRYEKPGQYKLAHPLASGQFCYSAGKIMERYNFTFREACSFLEELGYLGWAGHVPIWNVASDVLWKFRIIFVPDNGSWTMSSCMTMVFQSPYRSGELPPESREDVIAVVSRFSQVSEYKTCAVFGENDCVYCEVDGRTFQSSMPPSGVFNPKKVTTAVKDESLENYGFATIHTIGVAIILNYFALVIKNQALEQKYKGGLNAFVKAHEYCIYNDDIFTMSELSLSDLEDAANDIKANGLINKEDYLLFAAFQLGAEDYCERDFKVGWLKAYCLDGKTLLQYAGEAKATQTDKIS